MIWNVETIIYALVLIDSILANIFVWFFPRWYKKNIGSFYKHFPASKGWVAWYFLLVLWLGYTLNRIGVFTF